MVVTGNTHGKLLPKDYSDYSIRVVQVEAKGAPSQGHLGDM